MFIRLYKGSSFTVHRKRAVFCNHDSITINFLYHSNTEVGS
jgi:hypothetical protein